MLIHSLVFYHNRCVSQTLCVVLASAKTPYLSFQATVCGQICIARPLLRSHDFSVLNSNAMNPHPDPVAPRKSSDLLKRHRNLARAAKEFLKPLYARIPRFAVGPTPEDDRLRFERIFKPWPKWVFRLLAEHWHVGFPTVPKEVIFQTLRVLNVIVFRCRLDPDEGAASGFKFETVDRIDPAAMELVLAAIFGHGLEHLEAARKKLDASKKNAEISEAEYAEMSKSLESFDEMLEETLATWSKDKNLKLLDLTRAIENARRKTWDRHGRGKETSLTPIYRKMLSNWIIVENMTGPKELANFLYPNSKGDADAAQRQFKRVESMCNRLGLRFRGRVKTF